MCVQRVQNGLLARLSMRSLWTSVWEHLNRSWRYVMAAELSNSASMVSWDPVNCIQLCKARVSDFHQCELQGWKASLDKAVMTDLGAWLMHGGTPDTTINTQKVRSCWIYSPTTNNVDVSCSRTVGSGSGSVMQRLGRYAVQQGVPAAMLRPSVMNAKHSGCKLAQSIFEQVAPDGDVPTACTLQDVADACTAQRKRGKPAGALHAFKLRLLQSLAGLPESCSCIFLSVKKSVTGNECRRV